MYRLSTMIALIIFAIAVSIGHPAEAQHVKRHRGVASKVGPCILTNDGRRVCRSGVRARNARSSRPSRRRAYARRAYAKRRETIIGGRPAGCPHAYCGCGLRKYLGLSDKRLNLAINWARLFPRVASPRAGVAAVRNGHVMYIERSVGNGRWMVRDYNSGGGLSRLHVRDVRGYVYVDPHVRRLLMAKNR